MLSSLWNELPPKENVNYKLTFKRGTVVSVADGNGADQANHTGDNEVKENLPNGHGNSVTHNVVGASVNEALEQKLWAEHDKLKRQHMQAKSESM